MTKGKDVLLTIEPARRWRFIDFRELFQYADLFRFLVWRDIRIQYAQTVMGFSWAIVQPVIQIVLFTIIFGRIAQISTDGVPYVLFAAAGIIPWNYISQALISSCNSLVTNQHILSKIYFPRIIYPLAPVASYLLDFLISLAVIVAALIYYRVPLTWNLIQLPLVVLVMAGFCAGVGIWLSAFSVRFRDVKVGMPFVIRMLMYTAPVVYPVSKIPPEYLWVYCLNPVVAIVEGFRACILGYPLSLAVVGPGALIAMFILVSGIFYFQRIEHIFVDVV